MLALTPRLTHEIAPALSEHFAKMPTLARILSARGVTSVDEMNLGIEALLPAKDLLGMGAAVTAIDAAIDCNDKILIVGDFDCDGATSTTLMVRCLRQMGADVDFIVPDRFKYGYGLTPEIVEVAVSEFAPKLIITVDNGIVSHEGVETARTLGVDVVITDHHLTTTDAPNACAVVNPNQVGCQFASKSLVGVGVAFYVMGALAKHRRTLGKSSTQVSTYLDLVALGTVADVGVLDQNNRILVNFGLERIRHGQCCLGIIAILEQAGRRYTDVTATDFGFAIAPRINAAGRMDNMKIGIECLLADDWETARELAGRLNELNVERRQVEQQMKVEAHQALVALGYAESECESQDGEVAPSVAQRLALARQQASDQPAQGNPSPQVSKRSVVLYQDDWHQGVIGIVAGRIKDKLYRPTVIFAPSDLAKTGDEDFIKGSARSIAGVHIRDAIEEVARTHPNLIGHFGGHAMAAGLTIKKANFERFVTAFEQVLSSYDQAVFFEQKFTDGRLLPQDFSLYFADILKHLTVWGHGFLSPVFDGVFEVISFRILKDKHLKLLLNHQGVQYPIDAIWFNYDSALWEYRTSHVHLLFELDINEWQGSQNLQLRIKDLAIVARD